MGYWTVVREESGLHAGSDLPIANQPDKRDPSQIEVA